MPKKKEAVRPGSAKHPKFAPLTLDFTFKREFASEQNKNLLIFLLNAFLAEKLESKIKDVKIIDKELLGKTKLMRNAIFDVYCEDAAGAKFIVEVQIKQQAYFIMRTLFYLCTAVTNLASKGKKYDFNIPKLHSISFLDFDLDFGKNCDEAIQHLSLRNDTHCEVSYDMIRMTFVLLPRFNKTESECETIADKIIFAMKNGHKLKSVPKSFREKELIQIFEIAKVSNFTKEEKVRYEAAMMNKHDYNATIAYARNEGFSEGEAKGEARGKKEGLIEGIMKTAKSMLKEGLDPARVARITGLPKKQIMALM